jgi:hypothetical protein
LRTVVSVYFNYGIHATKAIVHSFVHYARLGYSLPGYLL